MKLSIFLLLTSLFFTACSSIPTVNERIKTSNELIKEKLLKKETIRTDSFSLYSLQKISSCHTLRVYIEGDGLSWISRRRVSHNPTPINPLAMKLFLKDPSSCKLYLARPCQYTNDTKCEKRYWTSHRFSKEIIDSYTQALEKIKSNYDVSNFELIGFSGGGAIAALIASNQDDISYLITIAGNLDHKAWTKQKRVTPLYGSLNPINYSEKLKNIRQVHLIGSKDRIITPSIFNSYVSYFSDKSHIKSITYKEFTHQKGWEKNWDKIINIIYIF